MKPEISSRSAVIRKNKMNEQNCLTIIKKSKYNQLYHRYNKLIQLQLNCVSSLFSKEYSWHSRTAVGVNYSDYVNGHILHKTQVPNNDTAAAYRLLQTHQLHILRNTTFMTLVAYIPR
jgi:hypothetical protein